MKALMIAGVIAASWIQVAAQGTFQSLDFESATVPTDAASVLGLARTVNAAPAVLTVPETPADPPPVRCHVPTRRPLQLADAGGKRGGTVARTYGLESTVDSGNC